MAVKRIEEGAGEAGDAGAPEEMVRGPANARQLPNIQNIVMERQRLSERVIVEESSLY
jgi:hypothetical protein